MIRRLVERLIDSGRKIGIIRRYSVRHIDLTGQYHHEFHFKWYLKVERQPFKQVVLLFGIHLSTKINVMKKSRKKVGEVSHGVV